MVVPSSIDMGIDRVSAESWTAMRHYYSFQLPNRGQSGMSDPLNI